MCLKRGGDRCFAVQGVGKLRVTGGDCCFIAHSSDTAVALTSLGAFVTIASPGWQRTVPIEDYLTRPDANLMWENLLRPGELPTADTLPPVPDGFRSIYLKAWERESGDFALVSVAATIGVTDGVVTHASVVVGGVAPTPYRAVGTGGYLRGRAAADVVAAMPARPLPDNAYKITMAANLMACAVSRLL